MAWQVLHMNVELVTGILAEIDQMIETGKYPKWFITILCICASITWNCFSYLKHKLTWSFKITSSIPKWITKFFKHKKCYHLQADTSLDHHSWEFFCMKCLYQQHVHLNGSTKYSSDLEWPRGQRTMFWQTLQGLYH